MKTFSFIFGLFLCVACNQIIYLPIDTKVPSEVGLSQEKYNTVLVVDNTSPLVLLKENPSSGNSKKTKVLHVDSLGSIFTSEFAEGLQAKGFGTSVLYTTSLSEHLKQSDSISILPADTIRKMATEVGADIVLTIDNLKTDIRYSNNSIYEDSLYTEIAIHIFSPEAIKLLPTAQYDFHQQWKVSDRRIFSDNPILQKAVKSATALFSDVMSSKFVPQWQTQERWYYGSSIKELLTVADFIQKSEWVKAAKFWGNCYETEKKESKLARLASNIALANEMNDDIKNAIVWVNLAKEHKMSAEDLARLEEYEKQLQKRLLEFNKMDGKKNQ